MSKFTLKDLELPVNEPMVIIRSSLLWMCDGDKYAAAVLNMYIHWTRWLMKHKDDGSLILYRKQSELVQDLLGFCSDRRLRQANTLLVDLGLLKIDDTATSLTDRILKYELQIPAFKKLMKAWKEQYQNNDEEALENTSDETDNFPTRSRKLSDGSSVRDGKLSETTRKIIRPIYEIDKEKEMITKEINRKRDKPPAAQEQFRALSSLPLIQQHIFLWFCEGRSDPPPLDAKRKQHLEKLAEVIKKREDFDGLYAYTLDKVMGKSDPIVHLGNMVTYRKTWEREREKKQSNPFRTKPEPTEHKADEFIDELVQDAATVLGEQDDIERSTAQMKHLYQQVDDDAFRDAEEEALIEAKAANDGILTEHRSRLDYYVWFTHIVLGVQRPQEHLK